MWGGRGASIRKGSQKIEVEECGKTEAPDDGLYLKPRSASEPMLVCVYRVLRLGGWERMETDGKVLQDGNLSDFVDLHRSCPPSRVRDRKSVV